MLKRMLIDKYEYEQTHSNSLHNNCCLIKLMQTMCTGHPSCPFQTLAYEAYGNHLCSLVCKLNYHTGQSHETTYTMLNMKTYTYTHLLRKLSKYCLETALISRFHHQSNSLTFSDLYNTRKYIRVVVTCCEGSYCHCLNK